VAPMGGARPGMAALARGSNESNFDL